MISPPNLNTMITLFQAGYLRGRDVLVRAGVSGIVVEGLDGTTNHHLVGATNFNLNRQPRLHVSSRINFLLLFKSI